MILDVVSHLVAFCVGLCLLPIGLAIVLLFGGQQQVTLTRHFIAGYVVRLVFAIAYYRILFEAGSLGFGFNDDLEYHRWAEANMRSLGSAVESSTVMANSGFFLWSAFLYSIFGPNTLVVRVFNSFVGMLWLVPVARLAEAYGEPRVTRLSIILTAWLPPLIWLQCMHFKDAISGLALLCALVALPSLADRPVRNSVAIVVCSIVLAFFRRDLLGWVYAIAVLALSGYGLRGRRLVAVVTLALMIGAGAFTAFPLYATKGYGAILSEVNSNEDLTEVLSRSAKVGDTAGFLGWFFVRNVDDLWKLPLSMVAAHFVPFPSLTDSGSVHSALVGWANVPTVLFLPLLAVGFLISLRRGPIRHIVVHGMYAGGIMSVALMGLGVIRYREQFGGLLAILVALGFEGRRLYGRILLRLYSGLLLAVVAFFAWKFSA